MYNLTMNKKLTLLLIFPVISLNGCSKLKGETAIHSLMSKNHEVIELSALEMMNMVNEGFGMTVLFYTEQCSYCEEAKTAIKTMAERYDYAMFEVEINKQSEDYLKEHFTVADIGEYGYPTVRLFDNGKLNYTIMGTDMLNYRSLRRQIIPQLIETDSYYQEIKLPN